MTGAPLAGLLIAVVGPANVLWLDALSYGLSAVIVLAAVPIVRHVHARQGYLRDVVEGLQFISHDRVVLTFLALATVGNMIMSTLAAILLPVYAQRVLDSAVALGLMIAFFGAGGLLGVGLFALIGTRLPRGRLFRLAWLGFPATAVGLVLLPPLPVLLGTLLALGLVPGLLVPLYSTVLQERTPPRLRGRVFSTTQAARTAVVPFGLLAAGLLVESLGVRAGLAAFAASLALLALAAELSGVAPRLERAGTEDAGLSGERDPERLSA